MKLLQPIAVLLLTMPCFLLGQDGSVFKTPAKSALQAENKIVVEKFDPEDSCISVEGDSSETADPDPFLSCAQAFFKEQLALYQIPEGTQSNKAAADVLKKCLDANPKRKTLLIGHGQPGRIWTGDGHDTPPGKDQSLVAEHPVLDEDFKDLDSPQLTLLGCWVGAEDSGQTLVNVLASVSNPVRRVRAQNSVVFCSVEEKRKGFFLDVARAWVEDTLSNPTATPKPARQLLKDIAKPACICIKNEDDMCGESVDLSLNGLDAKFPSDEVQLTAYTPASEIATFTSQKFVLPSNNFRALYLGLLKKNTENLVDQIGFCSPSQPGIPDLTVVGNFILTIHGKPRQFDVLGTVMVQGSKYPVLDVMVRDHSHPEELYLMKSRAFQQFHKNFQTQWHELLQQNKSKNKQKGRAK